MKQKAELKKEDPAGVLNEARQMVSQLQEQAKNGQIDGRKHRNALGRITQ